MTARQQRYADIAARHTPEGVRIVPLAGKHQEDFYGLAHAFPETEEEEEDFVPWIELAYPEPKTLRQLWTYVHELAHLRRRHYPRAESDEFSAAEAD